MSEWILRQIGPSLAPLITERLRSAVEKQGVTPMVTHPTYVAALCVLAANNGSAVPAHTHVVGGPDESAEHLLGRAVIATRQQFPGCSIVDLNVAAVEPGVVLASEIDAMLELERDLARCYLDDRAVVDLS